MGNGGNKSNCCPQGKQCEDYMAINKPKKNKGCPTGFKPCMMELKPPPLCDPCGVWCAKVQPCPPKYKKISYEYHPKPCRRPCCKHYKGEDPCDYDGPCKAHCFNTPVEKRATNAYLPSYSGGKGGCCPC